MNRYHNDKRPTAQLVDLLVDSPMLWSGYLCMHALADALPAMLDDMNRSSVKLGDHPDPRVRLDVDSCSLASTGPRLKSPSLGVVRTSAERGSCFLGVHRGRQEKSWKEWVWSSDKRRHPIASHITASFFPLLLESPSRRVFCPELSRPPSSFILLSTFAPSQNFISNPPHNTDVAMAPTSSALDALRAHALSCTDNEVRVEGKCETEVVSVSNSPSSTKARSLTCFSLDSQPASSHR